MRKVFYSHLIQLLLFFLLLLPIKNLLAQETGTLRGLVVDSTTSEALAFSSAYIRELKIGANTDARGYFLITSVPANQNLTLVVSYVGYKTKSLKIRISEGKLTHYNISLSPTQIELQTIETIDKRNVEKNETNISLQRIAIRDLEALPKGVETDVFRSIKYLPGIQSTGDVSAQYYVRGGASNQNLVMIDGITVYNPFHALGLFSVIDPDMINNIEFYKGGFSAEYGGRLSSVMKIVTNDGNKNTYGAKATASLLSGKLLLEGPIPYGSFIITGRKSYSNDIIKKFMNNQTIPIDFYDLSFKLNYSNPEFILGSKFSVNGFSSADNIIHNDPRIEDYKWSNNIFGFKWFQLSDSPLFFEVGVSVSSFKGEVLPKLSDARSTKNAVNDIGMQMDFTYMFDSKDEIDAGFHIKQIQTDLFLENSTNIPVNLGSSAANIIFYSKYKLMRWDFFGLDAGIRINLTSLSRNPNANIVEPRLNFTLRLLSQVSLKGAVGIYQQEITTISDENEIINIFEPWIITPPYLTPSRAIHYILGLEAEPLNNFSLTVEGYYKYINNLPLLNENKVLWSDPDFVAGNGESYGLEVFTKINPDPINFTISYTYAHAYKELDGLRYYPRYDIRHSLNVALEFNLGDGWRSSAVWMYNSGLPFTQILGYYDKYYLSNIFAAWNRYDPRQPFTILGIQNLGRLPDYHRLDLTLSKKFKINPLTVTIDLSVINVYNRENIFYFKRDTGERVNMLPFLPSATVRVEL
ncbi:MAG: TonB-dependent receptor [Ignavibacteriales bacterium]|nr:TonB-dependent receptor [Ignavibacteriales bacterium]